jgi:hypothetical protein
MTVNLFQRRKDEHGKAGTASRIVSPAVSMGIDADINPE